MTDITQTPDNYPEGVYQLAVTDPVLGGPEGPDNKAAIALANRTHYQRMRNVTPWRAGVGNEYPAHAYVQHGGVTWKSKVAVANIEPGTDAAKWIRWGYTADELLAFLNAYIDSGPLDRYALDIDLAAYLLISQFDTYVFNKGIRYSAAVCPDGGPSMAPMSIAAPTLAVPFNVYKSALGEVWMYLDNKWRVVAGHHGVEFTNGGAAYPIAATGQPTLVTWVAPRTGNVNLFASLFAPAPQSNAAVFVQAHGNALRICGEQSVSLVATEQQYISMGMGFTVANAGDVFTISAYSQYAWNPFVRTSIKYVD